MKKNCVPKILLAVSEPFFYNYCNYYSYNFNYKFALIHFLSFLRIQKKESHSQQAGSLVTKNISVFCCCCCCCYLFFSQCRVHTKGAYAYAFDLRMRNNFDAYICVSSSNLKYLHIRKV